MNELQIWKFILSSLNDSQPVILLCVVDSQGSSPGRKGFKMAVTADEIFGSIGGGIMEHKFVEMAKERLRNVPHEPLLRKQVHSKVTKKDQSGMICSGEQTILLFNISNEYARQVEKIIHSLEENRKGLLRIAPYEIIFSERDNAASEHEFKMQSETEWSYSEKTGYKNHLYIVGGGHCSYALSKLIRTLDFYVHVFEDRNNLNTFESNSFAHEKILVDDYSALQQIIPSGENNYVVIMTFGYRTDDVAFRTLINNDYKYLGVLGSKTKMEKMFEEWKKDFPEERLKKVFAPIGIQINSQTPNEIAISIAAEIISIKNK